MSLPSLAWKTTPLDLLALGTGLLPMLFLEEHPSFNHSSRVGGSPMIECAYCERLLICESCRTPYKPPSQQHYEALSQAEVALGCPECGAVLVCHWCKTPYDGGDKDSDAPAARGA
jgi:hypothetical protein